MVCLRVSKSPVQSSTSPDLVQYLKKKLFSWEFLGGPVDSLAPSAGAIGLIPGQGTEFPQVTRHGQEREKWRKKEKKVFSLFLLMRKLKLNEVQWCIYSKSQSRRCLKEDGRKPSSSGVLWVQRKMVITMGEDLLGNPLDSPAGCFAWTLQRSSSWKSPQPTMWLLIIFSVIILSWIFHESWNFSHSWPWRNVFC